LRGVKWDKLRSMNTLPRAARTAFASLLILTLAACAGQKEPAQKLLAAIDATTTAASSEAAKYIPDQLKDVQDQYGALKASFAKQDYAAVVTQAPGVLSAAESLAIAAAAKKDEVLKALNDGWTQLAAVLPEEAAAVQARIDLLSKKSSKKLAAGIDVEAAKSEFAATNSLWSKAQAAFAAGNLDEAVTTAKSVKAQLDAAAGKLKVAVPAAK
jgi:hypothetical protein